MGYLIRGIKSHAEAVCLHVVHYIQSVYINQHHVTHVERSGRKVALP